MFDLHICASSCTYFEDSSLRAENNIFEALFSFFLSRAFSHPQAFFGVRYSAKSSRFLKLFLPHSFTKAARRTYLENLGGKELAAESDSSREQICPTPGFMLANS